MRLQHSRGLGAYVYVGEGGAGSAVFSFWCCSTAPAKAPKIWQGKSHPGELLGHQLRHLRGGNAHIIATHNKYKDKGYHTLAVAMSTTRPSYVVNFAQSRQLPFNVALDNTGNIAKSLGDVKLTPTTYIVNKRGEIVKTYIGAPNFVGAAPVD